MQDTIKTLATKDELKAVADGVKIIKTVMAASNNDVRLLDARANSLSSAPLRP